MIVLLIVFMFDCHKSVTGPDRTPRPLNVTVKYIRIEPYITQPIEAMILSWDYGQFEGGACVMSKIAEGVFTASALIKTEMSISMTVMDNFKEGFVRKRIFINDQELIFQGSEYGNVAFIYHNDGTIEITYPR